MALPNSNGRNQAPTVDIFDAFYPPPYTVETTNTGKTFDGMQWSAPLDTNDAVYGVPGGPLDGVAYYWPNASQPNGYWRVPKSILAGWAYGAPASKTNHPAGMSAKEIERLPGGVSAEQSDQVQRFRRQRQQQQDQDQGDGGGSFDLFGSMFGSSNGDGGGGGMFNLFGSGSDGAAGGFNVDKLMQMMMQMYGMQFMMGFLQNMMGGMGGGLGGAGGTNAIVGPMLQRQAANNMTTNLGAANTALNALTFTSGGATGPEVAALRTAIVNYLNNLTLQPYASAQGSAALVQALTGPGANSNGSLALALI